MNKDLRHWGILGMKWGIRRYQNPDGTYTQEGKARRLDRYKAKEERRRSRLDRKQPWRYMTDDELSRATSRMQKENSYAEAYEKHKMLSRPQFVRIGTKVAIGAVSGVFGAMLTKYLSSSANGAIAKGQAWVKDKFSVDIPLAEIKT